MNKVLCLALLLTASSGHALPMPDVPAVETVPVAARQAAAGIDPAKIRAHVRFLSSDLLEGRGPGKRGGQLAAEYIATQFALAGAKPAGDNGTFFQSVPLMAVHTDADQTNFTFVPASGSPIPLKYGEDYVTKDQTGAPITDLDAPIVFVGYGINAPGYEWNDYDGLDVKGKVLLVIVNQPRSNDKYFSANKALTYYGRWVYKYEEAARKGRLAFDLSPENQHWCFRKRIFQPLCLHKINLGIEVKRAVNLFPDDLEWASWIKTVDCEQAV